MSVFSIKGKGLKLESENDFASFISDLSEDVEEICLSGNTWSREACEKFAELLKNKKNIKRAIMDDIFTGRLKEIVPPSIKAFGNAFEGKNLVSLDLSDNAFGPSGAEALMGILINNRSIEYLRINNNGLGPQGGKHIAQALIQAQRKNEEEGVESRLKTIIIGRNRLENGSMLELGEALSMHKNLVEVCLPQNGIRPEGIKVLLQHLSKCTNLETLDLQDNTFTESGSFALSEALPSWPKLEKLNIGDCLLNKEGCMFVLNSLKKLSTPLVYLNMQYSELDEEGALLLASFLESFPKMITLMLNGNCFNPEGVAAEAIKSTLERMQKEDILDSWSDMDYESELESEGEPSEEESDSEKERQDDLAKQLNSLNIAK